MTLTRNFSKILLVCAALASIVACSTHEMEAEGLSGQQPLSTPSPAAAKAALSGTQIRAVDFGNFSYPLVNDKTLTLRNGKYEGSANGGSEDFPVVLSHLEYGDVTRDGNEEALVVLLENVRGTAIPYYVYVYGIENRLPKLLWKFETGDRADGGLRRVYAENGDLVIEIYGNGTSIGGKLYGTELGGACCPRFVTRTRYAWHQNQFETRGAQDVFPNTSRGAPVPMTKYEPK